MTYRVAPSTSYISQLNLYSAYKSRFDPYASHTPLLGGQELIQLACATFAGCEMARDDGDYLLSGGAGRADTSWDLVSGSTPSSPSTKALTSCPGCSAITKINPIPAPRLTSPKPSCSRPTPRASLRSSPSPPTRTRPSSATLRPRWKPQGPTSTCHSARTLRIQHQIGC